MSEIVPARCLSSISPIAKPRRSGRYSSSLLEGKCQPQRTFATSRFHKQWEVNTRPTGPTEPGEANVVPRWKTTPAQMVAPFRSKPPPRKPSYFAVNEDPERLDKVYMEVLGKSGDQVLTEEVKWLAVTHKSFDQGRRGYNDRLAFLGMVNYVFMRNQY